MGRVYKHPISVYKGDMGTALKFITVAVICYAAVIVWMYLSQKKMLYYPRTEHVASPDLIGLHYEDVTMQNELGNTIHGWWVPHPAPRFTVLFSHGNGGNVSHRLESLRIFHQMGLATFVYDYSGYGKSEGEPGEEAMRSDALTAWNWLVQTKNVPPSSIILFGRSLGGAVTARLAADVLDQGERPAGLVLESTFTSIPEMGAYIYPWLPVRYLARYQYDSTEALKGRDLPILFGHSPEDEIVPYELGRRLYTSYSGPKTFMEMRGAHNSGYLFMDDAYIKELEAFISTLEQ